jgi:PilZ domain-containing protein
MPMHTFKGSNGPYARERRYRRFDLQFPVRLSFSSRGTVHELDTMSRNISIGGLLLRANDSLPPHTRVSLTMDVQGPRLRRPVRLLSEGEVVRVERLESGAGFAIAIECEHPITDMENHLPAAG